MKNSKGQIWVETVIYTLIGLSIIAIVLSIVLPQIEEQKDKLILDQSYSLLTDINSQIENLRTYGEGNSQPFEIKLNKGSLMIGGINESISFALDGKSKYSEPGQEVILGDITALTVEKKNSYLVSLSLNYTGKVNITWQGKDENKQFQASSVSYRLFIVNQGASKGLVNIDFRAA